VHSSRNGIYSRLLHQRLRIWMRFMKVGRKILVSVDQHFANYLPYPFQYTIMDQISYKRWALEVLRTLKVY